MTINRTFRGHDQRGSALIITLLLVAILVSMVVSFAYEVHVASSSFSNWSNAQRASIAARSGLALASRYLDEIADYTYTDKRKIELPVELDLGPGSELSVVIEDENSKFNVNSIIYQNGRTDQKALSSLKKLLDYLNINPDIALLIADWIDPDSEPRLRYAEDRAKNSFLWSIDELMLIEGIDRETSDKLVPYLTVSEQWGRKININTAEIPVLVSMHKDMTETLAQRIVEYREDAPFEDWSHVQKVSGMERIGQELAGTAQSKSTEFRITSTATVNGIRRVIESVVDSLMVVRFWREG